MRTRKYKLFFALFLFGCSIAAYSQNNEMTVTDCQGNIYPVVKIGEQYWMAENLRCTQYDSKSECPGTTIHTVKEVFEFADSKSIKFQEAKYLPYYIASDDDISEYSKNLTEAQRKKLGLLYNWSATMGLCDNKSNNQLLKSSEYRQGVCPNGWHIPTMVEWETLSKNLNGKKHTKGYHNIGKKLKSKSGWYSIDGTNSSKFNALPAGNAMLFATYNIGTNACFWTATQKDTELVWHCVLLNGIDDLFINFVSKSSMESVRCIKD